MAGLDPAIQQPHETASYSLSQRVLHPLGAAGKRPEPLPELG